MVSEGLVLTAINKKFEGKSLTKTFKENLAKKWAFKIDNETEIDSYIDDREDVILEASTEADRRATEAVKKNTPQQVVKNEGQDQTESKDDFPADTPEWAKAIINQNKTLEAKINGFETQQTQKSLTERFKTHPELKAVPELMFKGRIPTKEEDFDAYVQELKNDYTAFATENKLSLLGKDTPNNFGGKNTNGEPKKATKEEIAKLFPNV